MDKERIRERIKELCESEEFGIDFNSITINFSTEARYSGCNHYNIAEELEISNSDINISVSGDIEDNILAWYALMIFKKEIKDAKVEQKYKEDKEEYKKKHPILGSFLD